MAARRARRARAGQSARNRAAAESRAAAEMKKIANRATARGIQAFAVDSMNELAQLGPAWSGEFASSWGFAPEGQIPQGIEAGEGRIKKYTKYDAPVREIEKYIDRGISRFSIVNTAPHAAAAIDEEASVFLRPVVPSTRDTNNEVTIDPIKEPTLGDGRNNPSLRYDIGGSFGGDLDKAPAARTAEPDWFITYVVGGGLQKSLSASFTREFKIEG